MASSELRIPLRDALQAHKEHQAGWSLRQLARIRYEQWGYASPASAYNALRKAFRELDLPVRDQKVAYLAAHEVHGNLRRALADPAHPEHDRYLAQKRRDRALLAQARRAAAEQQRRAA